MPIDRGQMDQQLEALGEGARWWDVRELRDLPTVLQADERIMALARGKIGRPRWLHRVWLIVVTDRRLLMLRSAARSGWRQLELSAAQVTRVTLRIGPLRGRVIVLGGGTKYRLLVQRPDGYRLLNALTNVAAPAKDALTGFGATRIARRMIDHVLSLPAVALGPDAAPALPPAPGVDLRAIEQRFQALEEEIERLREQVDFLEQLLRQRHTESVAAVEG